MDIKLILKKVAGCYGFNKIYFKPDCYGIYSPIDKPSHIGFGENFVEKVRTYYNKDPLLALEFIHLFLKHEWGHHHPHLTERLEKVGYDIEECRKEAVLWIRSGFINQASKQANIYFATESQAELSAVAKDTDPLQSIAKRLFWSMSDYEILKFLKNDNLEKLLKKMCNWLTPESVDEVISIFNEMICGRRDLNS